MGRDVVQPTRPRRTHDFRPDARAWGHVCHTWRLLPPRVSGFLWWRREHSRARCLVHLSPPPQIGDLFLYTGQSGRDRTAIIMEIDYLKGNPRDMYALVLEDFTPSGAGAS